MKTVLQVLTGKATSDSSAVTKSYADWKEPFNHRNYVQFMHKESDMRSNARVCLPNGPGMPAFPI